MHLKLLLTRFRVLGVYKLVKESSRIDIRKYAFSSRIVNIWNSLPNNVVHVQSVIQDALGQILEVSGCSSIGKPTSPEPGPIVVCCFNV